jgi:hypothetical protein
MRIHFACKNNTISLTFVVVYFQVFEDINLPSRPKLQQVLKCLNIFFAVAFSAEFLLKVFGLGVVSYFKNFWNCLDVLIVAVSTIKKMLKIVKPRSSRLNNTNLR